VQRRKKRKATRVILTNPVQPVGRPGNDWLSNLLMTVYVHIPD